MNETLIKTLKGLMNICIFRGSPAQLPFSNVIFTLIIVLTLMLNAVEYSTQLDDITWIEAIGATLLSWSLFAFLTYALLAQQKRQLRFYKTLLALIGTELLLVILIKLIGIVVPEESTTEIGTLGILGIFISIWLLVIKAYILMQALEIKALRAILTILGITFIANIPVAVLLSSQIQSQLS